MSYLKLSPNEFLEVQELKHQQEFIVDEGYIKYSNARVGSFGIVKTAIDFYFNNLKAQPDVAQGTISINPGIAIAYDSLTATSNIIRNQNTVNSYAIPNDGQFYWLKIAYTTTPIESGTVNVDAQGNMVGAGTSFLSTLRGQPYYPSRIRFPNSVLNASEYDVVSVTSDTSAVLAGTLNPESGLEYVVVGTFTPGYAVPAPDKDIYQYDSVLFSLVPEVTPNTPPARIQGAEFFICRVQCFGGNITVLQDKRSEFFEDSYQSVTQTVEPLNILNNAGQCAGVEFVQWEQRELPRMNNKVRFAVGYRSSNWSIVPTLNRIILNSGRGGRYPDNSSVPNGTFVGYYVYFPNGYRTRVTASNTLVGQINLDCDVLDSYLTSDAGTEIVIAPDCTNWEVWAFPVSYGVKAIGTIEILTPGNIAGTGTYFTGQLQAPYQPLPPPFPPAAGSMIISERFPFLPPIIVATVSSNTAATTNDIVTSFVSTPFYTFPTIYNYSAFGDKGTPIAYNESQIFNCNAQDPYLDMFLPAFSKYTLWNFRWRLITVKGAGPWMNMEPGQYYREQSFDDNGNFIGGGAVPYDKVYFENKDGNILLTQAPYSYSQLSTGDLPGIEVTTNPVTSLAYSLIVGQSLRHQRHEGLVGGNLDYIFNLNTANAKNGSTFYLDLQAVYAPSFGNGIVIQQDGNQIYKIESWDIKQSEPQWIHCEFDGSNWKVSWINKSETSVQYVVNASPSSITPSPTPIANWTLPADGKTRRVKITGQAWILSDASLNNVIVEQKILLSDAANIISHVPPACTTSFEVRATNPPHNDCLYFSCMFDTVSSAGVPPNILFVWNTIGGATLGTNNYNIIIETFNI